jgi:hypothetical protein
VSNTFPFGRKAKHARHLESVASEKLCTSHSLTTCD